MRTAIPLAMFLTAAPALAQRHARDGERVLEDRSVMQQSDVWIYNDLEKGFAEAKKTGKPLAVVFR